MHVAGQTRPALTAWVAKWAPRLTAAGAAALVDFLAQDVLAKPEAAPVAGTGTTPIPQRSSSSISPPLRSWCWCSPLYI
jgi:hypothetical protein